MDKIKNKDLIYPELCYKIMGNLFTVWNKVGPGHKENIYQKAVVQEFKNNKIKFEQQLPVKIRYGKEIIGLYYFDFLVEDKVVIELKVRDYFSKKDIDQLYSYLKAKDLKLGLITHFTKTGVKFKRVVNIK